MAKRKSFAQKKKKELIIIAVALLVVVGVSYAWLTQTISNSRENVIVAGKLELVLQNEDPILKLGGTYGYGEPMSDSTGLSTSPYTFTIRNTGTETAYYSLYLDDVASYEDKDGNTVNVSSTDRIADNKLKFQLKTYGTTCNSAVLLSATGNPRRLRSDYTCSASNQYPVQTGTSGSLAAGASVTYELRVWIDSSAVNSDVVGKVFAAKLRIEATQDDRSDVNGAAQNFAYY